MIFEDSHRRSGKRSNTLGTTFFRLGPKHMVSYVEFTLRSREDIYNFMKVLDENVHKPFDLYFLCESLDLKREYNKPCYFAVFTWSINVKESIEATLEEIRGCEILECTFLSVEELYKQMCERSFIEIDMFKRLAAVQAKTLRQSTNPFLQCYLFQKVSLLVNLDSATDFIKEQLPLIPNLHFYPLKTKIVSPEQRLYSNILFGTVQKKGIHLTDSDSQKVEGVYEQLKKYETRNEESLMIEEEEEFQDVYYEDFGDLPALPKEKLRMMRNLKEMRVQSITRLRDAFKDKERELERRDYSERDD